LNFVANMERIKNIINNIIELVPEKIIIRMPKKMPVKAPLKFNHFRKNASTPRTKTKKIVILSIY